jgi:putative transposase
MPLKRLKDIRGPKAVFITTTVIEWTPILVGEAAMIATKQLAETADYYQASVLGYVVMPSHVHALLGLKDIYLLSRYMQSYKGLVSRTIKATGSIELNSLFVGGKFRLWMRRFDDLIIESQKQFLVKLNYIHENPVRSGLTVKAESWIYSSAKTWLTGDKGLIKIDTNFTWLG